MASAVIAPQLGLRQAAAWLAGSDSRVDADSPIPVTTRAALMPLISEISWAVPSNEPGAHCSSTFSFLRRLKHR